MPNHDESRVLVKPTHGHWSPDPETGAIHVYACPYLNNILNGMHGKGYRIMDSFVRLRPDGLWEVERHADGSYGSDDVMYIFWKGPVVEQHD